MTKLGKAGFHTNHFLYLPPKDESISFRPGKKLCEHLLCHTLWWHTEGEADKEPCSTAFSTDPWNPQEVTTLTTQRVQMKHPRFLLHKRQPQGNPEKQAQCCLVLRRDFQNPVTFMHLLDSAMKYSVSHGSPSLDTINIMTISPMF